MSVDSLMMRVTLGPLVACLQLFGLYVVFHGHYSPGGGFQGGVLIGCSLFLPLLAFRRRSDHLGLSARAAPVLGALGALVFALIGAVPMISGHSVLDYGALPLPADPATRRSLGILGIELGVTLAVAGVVASLYHSLMSGEAER